MRVSVLVLCCAVFPCPALAITADQLWASWQTAVTTMDLELSAATEVRGDGSLQLTGLRLLRPGVEGSGIASLAGMTLTETLEGSVKVALTGDLRFLSHASMGISLVGSHRGLEMTVVEGAAGHVTSLHATSLTFAMIGAELDAPDALPPGFDGALNMAFKGLELNLTDTPGATRVIGIDLSASSFVYDYARRGTLSETSDLSTYAVNDVTVAGDLALAQTLSILEADTARDVAELLRDGLSLRLEATFGPQTGTEKSDDPLLPLDLSYSALPGRQDLVIDAQRLSTSGDGPGLALILKGETFPGGQSAIVVGPVTYAFSMPGPGVAGGGDWGVQLSVSDLVLGEGLWNSFDPEGLLGRAAGAFAIDLGWHMDWDLFAALAAGASGDIPREPVPESLTLRQLALSGAGVLAEASGAFTFAQKPDGGLATVVPEGSGDLKVSGVNALINALISLGALTRDEATGLRMGMAAFLKPEGEDRFTSRLEAQADGKVFVNGARLK